MPEFVRTSADFGELGGLRGDAVAVYQSIAIPLGPMICSVRL